MMFPVVVRAQDLALLHLSLDADFRIPVIDEIRNRVFFHGRVKVMEVQKPRTIRSLQSALGAFGFSSNILEPLSDALPTSRDFTSSLRFVIRVILLLIPAVVGAALYGVFVRHSLVSRLMVLDRRGRRVFGT